MKNTSYLLSITLLFAIACNNQNTKEEEHAHEDEIYFNEMQINNAGIQVGPLETLELGDTLRLQAQVQAPPQSLAQIHLATQAFVKNTYKYVGSPVKKGEVLGEFYHPLFIQMQQDYLEAKAQFDLLEQEYQRQKNLYSDSASSSKIFQRAQADWLSSKAQLQAKESILRMNKISPEQIKSSKIVEFITIKSPIDGVLTQVNANIGKLCMPEECIFEVLDTSHLHIEIEAFPKDVQHIKKGQKFYYQQAGSKEIFQAEVILLGASVDPNKRSIHIHAHPQGIAKPILMLNEYLKGFLITQVDTYQVLSKESVFRINDQWFAFVSEEKGHFKQIEIKVGKIFKNHIEVLSPKRSDYVVSGSYYLQSAMGGEGGHAH